MLLAATAASAAHNLAQPLAQVNVSNVAGTQAEVAIAIDPADDEVLLAGSNSITSENPAAFARVYSSTDGGATWSSEPGPFAAPIAGKRRCNYGDPAVAIDGWSRQYYAFLAAPCLADIAELFQEDESLPISLQVASRAGPGAQWHTASVFPTRLPRTDDKPAIGVDSSPASPYLNRVYLTWTRIRLASYPSTGQPLTEIVLSRSDDGGATWSKPVVVSDHTSEGSVFGSVASGRDGDVYVSWIDGARNIWLDRSVDGGRRFGADTHVDAAPGLASERCSREGLSIAAQRKRCITAAPLVTIDDREGFPERVYVTYGAPAQPGRPHDIFVAGFDGDLRAIVGAPAGTRRQVNPPDGAVGSDQFLPAAAVDRSNGWLWVCFYDTTGDRRRERVFYTCAASADGGVTWSRPVRAANLPSNVSVRGASPFQLGEYAGIAVANGIAHPIWTDTRNLAARAEEIYTTVLTESQLETP
jgi:hypothetical protein